MSSERGMDGWQGPDPWSTVDNLHAALSRLGETTEALAQRTDRLHNAVDGANGNGRADRKRLEDAATEVSRQAGPTSSLSQFLGETARAWRAEESREGTALGERVSHLQRALGDGASIARLTEDRSNMLRVPSELVSARIDSCATVEVRLHESLRGCEAGAAECVANRQRMSSILGHLRA
jgi:hypothetical protein